MENDNTRQIELHIPGRLPHRVEIPAPTVLVNIPVQMGHAFVPFGYTDSGQRTADGVEVWMIRLPSAPDRLGSR